MKLSRDADPTHGEYLRRRPERFRGFERTSRHLVMRDGTKIAIDVCLPRGGSLEKLPTVMRQTRYLRRFHVQPALRPLLGADTLDPMNAPMRRLLTSRGYAWVDVDARGSGASFGERPCPWWLDGEVADGAEIAEWITQQPWSNGRVASTGVSYEGTTADFLATTRHPAVRAIAPRFALYDVFTDVAFPGGLHSAYFTHAWETANAALDRNAPGEMIALIYMLQAHGMLDPRIARRLDRPPVRRLLSAVLTWSLSGVAPVDDDPGLELLRAAIASHAENYSVHDGALHIAFRDDSPPDAKLPGQTSDYFSPHSYVDRARDVAVLSYGGWFDGGYANSATKRYRDHADLGGDSRLLVGPWVHGGHLDMDPDAPGRRAAFNHAAELLRFFDQYLWPEPPSVAELPKVRYYLMGEGSWRAASTWPPSDARSVELHFAPERRLAPSPVSPGADVVDVDLTVGAGQRSRWRTLLCPFLHADGKGRSAKGYVIYETDPLDVDLVVAGNPILVLTMASNAPDGAIVAYLEDVEPHGDAHLLSEGELRTIHATRLVERDGRLPAVEASYRRRDALALAPGQVATHVIELLPLAMRFRRGHRLRLLLGGADVDHFTTPAGPARVRWSIQLTKSKLILPVLPVVP